MPKEKTEDSGVPQRHTTKSPGKTSPTGGRHTITPYFNPEKPEWEYWKKLDLWTLKQAVCLICKSDPEELESRFHPLHDSHRYSHDNQARELNRVFQIAKAAMEVRTLETTPRQSMKVKPRHFLTWAEGKDLSIPDELSAIVELEPSAPPPIEKKESEVEETESKLRHSTKVRIRCQEIAQELWDKHGTKIRSNAEMADRQEIIKIAKRRDGKPYTRRKIKEWLGEVAPPHAKKAGIRPRKPE
jgi:hypothetical protein